MSETKNMLRCPSAFSYETNYGYAGNQTWMKRSIQYPTPGFSNNGRYCRLGLAPNVLLMQDTVTLPGNSIQQNNHTTEWRASPAVGGNALTSDGAVEWHVQGAMFTGIDQARYARGTYGWAYHFIDYGGGNVMFRMFRPDGTITGTYGHGQGILW